jgi:hypothetical protein
MFTLRCTLQMRESGELPRHGADRAGECGEIRGRLQDCDVPERPEPAHLLMVHVELADPGLQKGLPSVLGYSAEPAELGYSGTARARS